MWRTSWKRSKCDRSQKTSGMRGGRRVIYKVRVVPIMYVFTPVSSMFIQMTSLVYGIDLAKIKFSFNYPKDFGAALYVCVLYNFTVSSINKTTLCWQ